MRMPAFHFPQLRGDDGLTLRDHGVISFPDLSRARLSASSERTTRSPDSVFRVSQLNSQAPSLDFDSWILLFGRLITSLVFNRSVLIVTCCGETCGHGMPREVRPKQLRPSTPCLITLRNSTNEALIGRGHAPRPAYTARLLPGKPGCETKRQKPSARRVECKHKLCSLRFSIVSHPLCMRESTVLRRRNNNS